MADIYFSNPSEIYKLSPNKGYFSSGWWDAVYCCNKQIKFPEQYIIDKLLITEGILDYNKSMIDIGANVGIYTISVGNKFKNVFTFEPNLYFNYLLHANIALYDMIDKVNISKELLSDTNEPVSFNGFAGDLGGCEQLYKEPKIVIPKKLDQLDFTDVGFIKIDVEGMEERILRGGEELLKKNNLPPILFEVWDPSQSEYLGLPKEFLINKKASLFNYLIGLGYNIHECWGNIETHLAIKE